MKITTARERFDSDNIPSHIRETALGTIGVDPEGIPVESQVTMSEKNFIFLLSLCNRVSEAAHLVYSAGMLRNMLNEMIHRSDPKADIHEYIEMLQEEINNLLFQSDIRLFIEKESNCKNESV